MGQAREWDEGDDDGPYDDPEPPPPRVVHDDPERCPFCGARVEDGELVWPSRDVLTWQPAGTRSRWRRERMAGVDSFREWWSGVARRPGQRCRSCRRVWFELRPTDADR